MRRHWLTLAVGLFSLACSSGGSILQIDDVTGTNDFQDVRGGIEVLADVSAHDIVPDLVQIDYGHWPEVVDETLEPGCQPGDGCFLDPCDENSQCLSGWCVEHLGDGVCTQNCQEECPPGWACQQVGSGPDVAFVCISKVANLCRPCATGVDCKSPGGAEDVCVHYGDVDGSFCGGACLDDDDCPWGFACALSTTVDGMESKQCLAESGVCPCSDKSVTLGLATPCSTTNEIGTCAGERVCTADGLSTCDAPVASVETCDGLDNDCDGETDEDTCDDGNECTSDTCLAEAGCQHLPLDGGECKDNNPCTVADTCVAGVCTGDQVDCDDNDPCTDDYCKEAGGCAHDFNQAPCDDEDVCTVADQCKEGVCSGVQVGCECENDADCGALEDGDLCNGTLVCDTDTVPHKCTVEPGTVVDCPAPEGPDAVCLKPVCAPETGACSFAPDHAGYLCDDEDPCTVNDLCQEGSCVPGDAINCNDGNVCTDDGCESGVGCTHQANDASCDDGDICTKDDQCSAAACQPGQPINCDDGNPCTDDVCAPGVGCQHLANVAACDDGNACTTVDQCSGGVCKGSTPPDCDDANACTLDTCEPAQGCLQKPLTGPACTDNNNCTVNDTCQEGVCVGGVAMDCDDDNPCTADSCNLETQKCDHLPQEGACDDGNACTLNDSCAQGKCKPGQSLDCDDDNVCTTDSCTAQTGCVHLVNAAPCDDGDLCTTKDLCALGDCVGGAPLACDDNNPCTTDSCDPDVGCVFKPNSLPCDDGSACTENDVCGAGSCKGQPVSCDDDNFCTNDACDPAQGCIYSFNTNPCDDGQLCTVSDVCSNGTCEGGGLLACDDGNPCTDDQCVEGIGCTFTANTAACDDADACTTDDTCANAECIGGAPPDCNDDNVCTDDGCEPELGCINLANAAGCDDGNACTANDTCAAKSCVGGAPPNCDDANVCTQDSCDPDVGCVHALIQPCCGNNLVEPPEECDDGNQASGDGCDATCQDEGLGFPPPVGYTETSFGGPWKICRADNSTAWVSANSSGTFKVIDICKYLGYSTANAKGGTCGMVCGYCGTPGKEYYDNSNSCSWPTMCSTVHWRCAK